MAGKPAGGKRVRVGAPKTSAAGVPGITHSLEYALEEMGPGRSLRTLLKLNQDHGFDCPSCAWPDPDPAHRKTAEFCENGAKAVAWEATRKRVGPEFFADHSVAELREADDHWLESNGRLTEPMYLAPGAAHYAPISWGDALQLTADRLRALDDPNQAVFYTSGRASNEAAFAYQLLARRLGTNNLPDCSNMCHESSGAALAATVGIGKGVVTLSDIEDHADLILIAGQNPGTNHPRMLTALEKAKRRGARIIAINPLPEAGFSRFRNPQTPRGLAGPGTTLADKLLPVRLNGDLALFAGLNRALLEREDARPGQVFDRDFIDTYCDGFGEAVASWRALDWAVVEQYSGLSRAQIEDCAADVVAATKLNRSHLHHGTEALLLPCLGRTERDVQAAGEQFVTVEDSMSMVHASRGRLIPASDQLRSEIAIITGLGHVLFGDDIGWCEMGSDYRTIRKHIEHVVPGFQAYEERVVQPGGFMSPEGRTTRAPSRP